MQRMGEPVRKFGRIWVALVKIVAEGIKMGYIGRFEQHGLLDHGRRHVRG